MEDGKTYPCRVKLEISSWNENSEETVTLTLEHQPTPGGGNGSVSCRTLISQDDTVRGVIGWAADRLLAIAKTMPPGSLGAVADGKRRQKDDWVLDETPAGVGAEYVKDALPYGEHMAMVNAEIDRLPDGRLKGVKGNVRGFKKIRSGSGQTEYWIITEGDWKQVKNIDEYINKHKLIIYKVGLPKQEEDGDEPGRAPEA